MKKNRIFRFLPLKWWDLLAYLGFVTFHLWIALPLDFGANASVKAAENLPSELILAQIIVVLVLCSWIANSWNYLFLLVFGAFQWHLSLQIAQNTVGTSIDSNFLMLRNWIPLLLVMQVFRIIKLNLYGEELAIPAKGGAVSERKVTFVDILCAVVALFIIVGGLIWTGVYGVFS